MALSPHDHFYSQHWLPSLPWITSSDLNALLGDLHLILSHDLLLGNPNKDRDSTVTGCSFFVHFFQSAVWLTDLSLAPLIIPLSEYSLINIANKVTLCLVAFRSTGPCRCVSFCTWTSVAGTLLVSFLKTLWPKATWGEKSLFYHTCYSSSLKGVRAGTWSKNHGRTLLSGVLLASFFIYLRT